MIPRNGRHRLHGVQLHSTTNGGLCGIIDVSCVNALNGCRLCEGTIYVLTYRHSFPFFTVAIVTGCVEVYFFLVVRTNVGHVTHNDLYAAAPPNRAFAV